MSTPAVITRSEALAARLLRYFHGKPCKNGHVSERQVSNWACMACTSGGKARRYSDDPSIVSRQQKQWRCDNPERYAAQKLRNLKTKAAWRSANLETVRAQGRAYSKANPVKARAACARRYATKLQATPAWAEQGSINAIYAECVRVTKETGIMHHVDHIVPMKGKTVCGLHVHYNLRVIPGVENNRKNAKLIPELVMDGHVQVPPHQGDLLRRAA